MPVVPMHPAAAGGPKPKGARSVADTRAPPSTPFALMAAAVMHSEGRLLPEDSTLPPQLGGKEP